MTQSPSPTRRSFLRRSALALAALVPLGFRLTQDVQAKPNDGRKPRAVAVAANTFIDECFRGGGEPEVGNVTSSSVSVTCTSDDGSWSGCTITSKPPYTCHGSGDSVQHFSHLGNLEVMTVAPDLNGLADGGVGTGEVAFTLTPDANAGRKRHKRQGRKH